MNTQTIPQFGRKAFVYLRVHWLESFVVTYGILIGCFAVIGLDRVAATMLFALTVAMVIFLLGISADDGSEFAKWVQMITIIVGGLICYFSHWIVTAPWGHYSVRLVQEVWQLTLDFLHWLCISLIHFWNHGTGG